jgi:uncharacterized protein (DUF58 family)
MTGRTRIVLALFAGSLFGALVSGRDVFYNLTYLWAILLIMSYAWSRVSLRGIELVREPRTLRAQVGRLFFERIALHNRSRFSKLWVETVDESELPGIKATAVSIGLRFRGFANIPADQTATVTVGMHSQQRRTWISRTLCTQRGRFRLGPMRLRSGDPFGLFPVTRLVPYNQQVVVLPMTVPLADFPLPTGRYPGGEALRYRTYQVTPNAASVRDYAPGDSFNRIHWPSTARRMRLIVKEFEFDPLADIWLFLDAFGESQFERPIPDEETDGGIFDVRDIQLPYSTIEYGVAATASIALHFLQRDRSVGLVTYGGSRHVIQPERGESQLYRILESLAVLRAGGEMSLADVLKIESEYIPRGSTVVLVTPASSNALLESIRSLQYEGRQPILVQLEADSFGGPQYETKMHDTVQRMGVPVRTVKAGQPLDSALSPENLGGRRYIVAS